MSLRARAYAERAAWPRQRVWMTVAARASRARAYALRACAARTAACSATIAARSRATWRRASQPRAYLQGHRISRGGKGGAAERCGGRSCMRWRRNERACCGEGSGMLVYAWEEGRESVLCRALVN
eukprot:115291-Chlamydomonas_euryale.AAC.2